MMNRYEVCWKHGDYGGVEQVDVGSSRYDEFHDLPLSIIAEYIAIDRLITAGVADSANDIEIERVVMTDPARA